MHSYLSVSAFYVVINMCRYAWADIGVVFPWFRIGLWKINLHELSMCVAIKVLPVRLECSVLFIYFLFTPCLE